MKTPTSSIKRPAIYQGTWYPSDKDEIAGYMIPDAPKRKVIAAVCPHAGWVYSGKVAGEVYSRMEPAPLYILIGPNHRGAGAYVSVFPEGSWETPLGNLPVNAEVARDIVRHAEGIQPEMLAHQEEHSLEVQLPFIKVISPRAEIVPISLLDYRPDICRELGDAIARAVEERGFREKAVLIASTDMSHYVPAEQARKMDSLAMDRILHMDPQGLLRVVADHDITMCGSGPTAAVLWAAKALGAKKAELVRYATSGDVTGDNEQVVSYAGFVVY
jgi:MEMO1 family protein